MYVKVNEMEPSKSIQHKNIEITFQNHYFHHNI